MFAVEEQRAAGPGVAVRQRGRVQRREGVAQARPQDDHRHPQGEERVVLRPPTRQVEEREAHVPKVRPRE